MKGCPLAEDGLFLLVCPSSGEISASYIVRVRHSALFIWTMRIVLFIGCCIEQMSVLLCSANKDIVHRLEVIVRVVGGMKKL